MRLAPLLSPMLICALSLSANAQTPAQPAASAPGQTALPGQIALLGKVASEVAAVVKAGKSQPVVVFDLDATLFDNRMRTLMILRAWATQPKQLGTAVAKKVLSLRLDQIEYLFADALAKVGVTDKATLDAIGAFWLDRFFTEWAVHDQVTPGGVEYVQALHKAGAFVVYLTGRDAPRMLTGTTQSLMISGYPIGQPRTQLIMKPHRKVDDEDFKQTVMDSLRRTGHVVAMFDNEPGNVNLMKTAFPKAHVIFLKTMFNPKGKNLVVDAGIPSVIDFRR